MEKKTLKQEHLKCISIIGALSDGDDYELAAETCAAITDDVAIRYSYMVHRGGGFANNTCMYKNRETIIKGDTIEVIEQDNKFKIV